MTATPMLSLRGIEKTWPGAEKPLLFGLDLDVAAGETVYLLGPNGAGKSTLLSLISGHDRVDAGQVTVNGRDITTLRADQRASWIGHVPQNPLLHQLPDQTILENILLAEDASGVHVPLLFPKLRRRTAVRRRLKDWQLPLADRLDETVEPLSGGEKQILAILMTFMREPKVLLLDEPATALDGRSAARLQEVIDATVHHCQPAAILVTHHLERALSRPGRIAILRSGTIVADLAPGDSRRTPESLRDLVWGEAPQ